MSAKSFTSAVTPSNSKLFNYCVPVPADITAAFLEKGSKRVVVVFNRTEPFQAALTPIGDGAYVLKINQGRMKKLGLEIGSMIDVELFPDDSAYGLPLPEELAELWKIDEEGKDLFHALTLGKQRTMLYIVSQGQNGEERLRRAVIITDHLKARGGTIHFKALAEEMKKG